jgi:valyl-tRNA synthetase
MNNIRDWCISRQLWWGHRIPAWHCSACGGVTVSRQDATACGECGSDHIAQDPDVLDTWFSSALWPFSTMGWPEKTETLAKFYPTTVMETGFDIIFFWVARMIFMGIHFMGEVPFRTVFLHAMVRDKEGQKMSKTKGNVVDPLHVIQGVIPGEIDPEERDNYGTLFKDFPEGVPPQGADALRITLAKYAAQGRDIKLDVKRVEGDRAFLNKLWNATKFALTHLEGWEPRALDVDKESLTPADRWILGRLQIAAEQVMSALGDFRINDAAHTIYGFFWHEFCDWYLELSKPVLYGRPEAAEVGGDAEGSKTVMAHVLETSLRLLHPIAPYITEQLWHALPSMAATQVTPSISLAPWPEAIEAHRFAEATADVELAIEVITAIRAIRGQTGVKPGVVIEELMLFSDGPVQRAEIARTDTYIRNLARVGRITMSASEGVERPNKTATAVVSGLELQIPLAGLIDVAEETARLTKELAKVEEDLKHVGGKLTNPKFMERAPDAVVNKEREKQREFITLKAALLASLEELQELG